MGPLCPRLYAPHYVKKDTFKARSEIVLIEEAVHDVIDIRAERVSHARVHVVLGDVTVGEPRALQRVQHLAHVTSREGQQSLHTVF